MYYREFSPSAQLSPFIKCYWTLETEASPLPTTEKILPDGCMELILHYGDLFSQQNAGKFEVQHRSFIYGQLDEHIQIAPTGAVGIFAIRFLPHGLAPFIDIPVSEFTSRPATLQELMGSRGKQLEYELMCLPNSQKRIAFVEHYLTQRLNRHSHKYDPTTVWCVNFIRSQNGLLDIDKLHEHIGLSKRQMERRFKNNVGLTLKRFARIVRFQHVLSHLHTGRTTSLTQLAYQSGYYDQAHFIKDFKAFSGINPKTYLDEEHRISDFMINGK